MKTRDSGMIYRAVAGEQRLRFSTSAGPEREREREDANIRYVAKCGRCCLRKQSDSLPPPLPLHPRQKIISSLFEILLRALPKGQTLYNDSRPEGLRTPCFVVTERFPCLARLLRSDTANKHASSFLGWGGGGGRR